MTTTEQATLLGTDGRATDNNVTGGADSAVQAIGKRFPKVDGLEKVTGDAQYVADLTMPGLLYAKVLRSTMAHAKILHIDTSRAEKLRGVKGIVTGADIPDRRWGMIIKDQVAMGIDRVRYFGEEVAAVAATSEEIAEAALELIEVEYEELPALLDLEEAFAEGAALIHDDKQRNVAISINVERGSVEAGFDEADLVLEETFTTGYQFHAYIEPIGTMASYDQSGRLTVWCNTQSVWDTRHHLAAALDKSEAEIRVIQPYVGGAFGGKVTDENNALVAALLAEKVRRPVRLLNSREDEFVASRPRMPSIIKLKMGFAKDGKITAKQSHILMDNGAFSARSPAILGVTALRPDSIYRQTNVKVDAYLVYTNTIPTGSMRGFGGPQMTYAQESMMDIAAVKLGIDRREFRLINATQEGDTTVHGSEIRSCGLSQAITTCGDLLGWDDHAKNPTLHRGVGLACLIHVAGKRHFGDWDGSNAVITVNEHGQVLIHSGEGDIGQGANTGVCQIASEELGVPMDYVNITPADTDTTLYCHGVHASRVIYISGNAVRAAAREVKRQLYETASDMLEANQDDLESRDGYISVKGSPEKRVFFRDVASTRLYRPQGTPIVGIGSFDPDSELVDSERYGNESGAYSFGAQGAEVEVDPDTGQVRVINYVCVNDVGTVINPTLAEGQVHGALAQGIGYSLFEEMEMVDGRAVGMNFHDYKMAAMADMPAIQAAFIQTEERSGPFGAKGLGEPGMVPTAAAVANAVEAAIGVRITSLPITPAKVLDALRRKEG